MSGSERAPLELAVVLPTFNERGNVGPMVTRIEATLGLSGWEAIFVDDDSRDGTADEARAISRVDPRVRVIQRIGRRGLASAAIEGMCATAAPFVAVMDADHQHDPNLLKLMLARKGSDLFLTRVSLVVLLAGAVWSLAGSRATRTMAAPLAFLLMAIPPRRFRFWWPISMRATTSGASPSDGFFTGRCD